MELTFLGTRGEIDIHSRLHRRHSALLVEDNGARVMIDCGADWLGRLDAIAPMAIVLTHAHRDHAAGLTGGAPCPVFATEETLDLIRRFPLRDLRRLPVRKSVMIGEIAFEAIPVQHSIRAPAVGYRVSARGACLMYLPDVAGIPHASKVLCGIDIYIGDGATIRRSMLRHKGGTLIGHAPIVSQLTWCKKAAVRRAIFTHCGSPIVRGDGRKMNALIRRLGHENGIDACLAHDGYRLALKAGSELALRG